MKAARRATLITAPLAVIAVSGCASGQTAEPPPLASPASTPSPAASGTPYGGLPDPRSIDAGDPTAVSRAALTCLWTVDTVIDRHGQRDAVQRAAPYLTPAYAAQLVTFPAEVVDSSWTQHRAHARLLLRLAHDDGAPPDTASAAHRQWQITITPVGRDGWHGNPVHVVAFTTLTRVKSGRPWRVSAINVS